MLMQKKTGTAFVALSAMAASALGLFGAPAQARPSNGALIIGGIAAYGAYAAGKHHRRDDNRGRYNYGYRGDYYGDGHNSSGYNRRDRYDRHDDRGSYGDPHYNGGGRNYGGRGGGHH